jgi:hypothetical protein
MRRKPSAGFSLHLDRVPVAYQWKVNNFNELMSSKSSAFGYESCQLWVWSLEMVQRCGGYTYEQAELRGRVGKVR